MAATFPLGIVSLADNVDGTTVINAAYMDLRDDELVAIEKSLGAGLVSTTALVSTEFSLSYHAKVESDSLFRLAPNDTSVFIGSGSLPNASRTLVVDRDFTTSGAGRIALFRGAITVNGGSSSIHGVSITPEATVTSGAHAVVSSLHVDKPMAAVSGGSVTDAASIWVNRAPTQATNNYALFVDDGVSRFDGDGTHVFELPANAGAPAGSLSGKIPVNVGGVTKYIPYYDAS